MLCTVYMKMVKRGNLMKSNLTKSWSDTCQYWYCYIKSASSLLLLVLLLLLLLLFSSSSSSSASCSCSCSSSIAVCCGPWLPIQSFSVPDSLWPLPACFCSHCILSPLHPHHVCDHPLFLVPSIVAVAIYFSTLSTWPYHLSRRDFVNLIITSPFNMSFIFLFVLILQPSPSVMDPIFLTIFLRFPECICFFHGHSPGFWPINQYRSY